MRGTSTVNISEDNASQKLYECYGQLFSAQGGRPDWNTCPSSRTTSMALRQQRSKLANEMDRSTLLPLGSNVVQQAHHVLALYDLVNAIDKVNRTNTLKENINKEPTVT